MIFDIIAVSVICAVLLYLAVRGHQARRDRLRREQETLQRTLGRK